MTKVTKKFFHENKNKISLDSFRISIPINQVNIIDNNLTDKVTSYTINNSTQEVLTERELKENSIKKIIEGVPFYFNIDNSFGECKVVILLNSKQLFSRYFEGVTEENLPIIFDRIISCNVIDIDYRDFIQQKIVDVDFKKDTIIELDHYQKSLDAIKQCGKLSSHKDDGCIRYKDGIQFSIRKTSRYISNPFFKIYHKELELGSSSVEFARRHLKNQDYKNAVRVEFTVKNKKHFANLGIEDNRLISILRLSDEQKDNIQKNIIKKHLSKRETLAPIKREGMNPSQQIIYDYTNLLLEKGLPPEGAINYIIAPFEGMTKSRKKKEIRVVYDNFIKGTIAEKRSIKMNSFFDYLGWD